MYATDPVTPEPRRFSIRLPRPLWIAISAMALVVVAVGLQIGAPIYRRNAALRELERLDANVEWRPQGPRWLRERVGDDRMKLFDDVIGVGLYEKPVTDATLSHLSGLTNLETLWLAETPVTDAGLVHLQGLTRLKLLSLASTGTTDGGLANLNRMKNLETLHLDGTQVTDAGLKHLRGLTNLQGLILDNTKVTDAGVAALQRALPRLKVRR
jgi:Leucine-rich repeat (LRR) protein